MIACEARRTDMYCVGKEDLQVRRGRFVGIVEPHGGHYWFMVRDLRRERPTIHGSGVDYGKAVTAVTQLLDALASQ